MTLLPRHTLDVDVAIVGSGFAGSLLSLALRSRGMRVALLDRARHPRFAIGESSTPLANLLLEELADRYDLPQVRPFSTWGTWQATYPHVGCGLKRGFSFFSHDEGKPFGDDASHARQMLVAASPHDAVADTHWYRPDVDHWLARGAERAGVLHYEGVALDPPYFGGHGVTLGGVHAGASLTVRAGFLVDASGPRGYLWRALHLGDAPLEWLPPTQGLYSHFRGVERWDEHHPTPATPPYPVDDAALHHVFDGAWMWVLRFGNGITSAGVAATDRVAQRFALGEGARGWTRLLDAYPSVSHQFRDAVAVHPFVHAPRLAHRVATVTGPAFALLPSAAGVIDPLLSTGFPLTLLGVGRLAGVLEATRPGPERDGALAGYAHDTVEELRVTERLVAALYGAMNDFPLFKRLASLYFAAASYTETVRRLGRPERARGFLLQGDPVFGPAIRALAARASALPADAGGAAAREQLIEDIAATLEPFDVAGLGDRSRRDWYPVRAEDLRASRERLGATAEEIDDLLARCGMGSGSDVQAATRREVTA